MKINYLSRLCKHQTQSDVNLILRNGTYKKSKNHHIQKNKMAAVIVDVRGLMDTIADNRDH
jgi:hypothetical protein